MTLSTRFESISNSANLLRASSVSSIFLNPRDVFSLTFWNTQIACSPMRELGGLSQDLLEGLLIGEEDAVEEGGDIQLA